MLAHYFELLKYLKRSVFAIFVGVVGLACGLSVFFLLVTPIYTASNKIVILPTEAELGFSRIFVQSGNVNPANLMSQTHIEYMLSRTVAASVIDKMIEMSDSNVDEFAAAAPPKSTTMKGTLKGGFRSFKNWMRSNYNLLNSGKHVPLDPYTDIVLGLQDNIKLELVEGTYIIEVSVSWSDPKIAAIAANLLAEAYIERQRDQSIAALDRMEEDLQEDLASSVGDSSEIREQLRSIRLARSFSIQNLRIIDPAVEPIYPSFPKVVLNTLIAIVASFFLIVFYLVFKDTFSGRVITGQDLANQLDGPTFGSVRLRRRKAAQKLFKRITDGFSATRAGRTDPVHVVSFGDPDLAIEIADRLNRVQKSRFVDEPKQYVAQPPNSAIDQDDGFSPTLLLAVRPNEFGETELRGLVEGFEDNLNAHVHGLVVRW